jgi:hypothetical protein
LVPTHVTPDGLDPNATPLASSGLAAQPRVIAAANANEVMTEQLGDLIEHAEAGLCGCPQCQRYLRVRSLLLGIFTNSAPAVFMAEGFERKGAAR